MQETSAMSMQTLSCQLSARYYLSIAWYWYFAGMSPLSVKALCVVIVGAVTGRIRDWLYLLPNSELDVLRSTVEHNTVKCCY